MYYGEFTVSFDDKGRMTLPRRIRGLSEGLGHVIWYLARGFDGSINLYNQDEWRKIEAQMATLNSMNGQALAFKRFFMASVADAKLDDMGRMNIPQHLRDMAGLGKEAILIGVGDHLELWNAEAWRAYQRQQEAVFTEMAGRLFAPTAGATQTEGAERHA